MLAVAPNKPVALIGVAVICIGDLAQPALSSIMSKHVAHHEQVPSSGSLLASWDPRDDILAVCLLLKHVPNAGMYWAGQAAQKQ